MNWSDDSDSDFGLPTLPGQKSAPLANKSNLPQQPKQQQSRLGASKLTQDYSFDDDDDGSDGDFGLPMLPSEKIVAPLPTTTSKLQQQPQKQLPPQQQKQPQSKLSSYGNGNGGNDDDDDDFTDDDLDLPMIGSSKPPQKQQPPQQSKSSSKLSAPPLDDNDDDDDDDAFFLPSLPSAKPKPQQQSQQQSKLATKTINLTKPSSNSIKSHQLEDDEFSEDDAIPQRFAYIGNDPIQPTPSLFASAVTAKVPFGNIAAPQMGITTNTGQTLPHLSFSGSTSTAPPGGHIAPPQMNNSQQQPQQQQQQKTVQNSKKTNKKAVQHPESDDDDDDDDDDWSDDADIPQYTSQSTAQPHNQGQITQTQFQSHLTQNKPQLQPYPAHHEKAGLLACGCSCRCGGHTGKNDLLDPEKSRVWRITAYYLELNDGKYDEGNVPICDNCECDEATVVCIYCDEFMCDLCYKVLHLRESMRKTHKRQHLEIFTEKFIISNGENTLNIIPLPQFAPILPTQIIYQTQSSSVPVQSSQNIAITSTLPTTTSSSQIQQVSIPSPPPPPPPPSSSSSSSSNQPATTATAAENKKIKDSGSKVTPEQEQRRKLRAEKLEKARIEVEAEEKALQEAFEKAQAEMLEKKLKKQAEKKALLEQKRIEREQRLKEKAEKKAKTVVIGDDEGVLDTTKDVFSSSLAPVPIVLMKKKTTKKKKIEKDDSTESSSEEELPKRKSTSKKTVPEPEPSTSSKRDKIGEKGEKSTKASSKYTDEDLFGSSPTSTSGKKSKSTADLPLPPKSKGKKKDDSDDDDDEDLFGDEPSKKSQSTAKKEPKEPKEIKETKETSKPNKINNDDSISTKISQGGTFGSIGRRSKKSIFDDDEDNEEDHGALIDKKFARRGGPF